MFIRPQEDHPKTSPHDVSNWSGSTKMCWRRLDMPSSGLLCHYQYQIKYFKAQLVTSSTRHVHMITRSPPEDQSSWRLQLNWKHADVLMPFSGLCHYQIKYFKAPLVMSSARHVHTTTRRPPEDQVHLKHADVLKTSWCLLQGYMTIKWNILRAQLVTSSTRQQDQSSYDVYKWTWSMNVLKLSWRIGHCYVTMQLDILKAPW